MAKLRAKRINQIIVLVAVCVGAVTLGFVLGSTQPFTARAYQSLLQQSDRKVIERYERPGEPFEFDNLAVKKAKIALNQRFSAKSFAEKGGGKEEDWLENLEFTLKNTFNKQRTFILLQLQFPETEVDGPLMVYHLRIGIDPKPTRYDLKYATPLALEPGNKVVFTLSAGELEMLKQFLGYRNYHLANLNKTVIRIASVVFDDGMRWDYDSYYKPNPNAPGGYERINPINQ